MWPFDFVALPALLRLNVKRTKRVCQGKQCEVGTKLPKKSGWIDILLVGNKQK